MGEEKVIRVAILDDHAVIREYLSDLCQLAGFEVVFASEDPDEFCAHIPDAVDVVMVDLYFENIDGTRLTDGLMVIDALLARRPGLRVLVLSSETSAARIESCFQHGALGYLFKHTAERNTLTEAIRAVYRGQRVSPPMTRPVTPVAEPVNEITSRRGVWQLTPREREVLAHVAAGYDNLKIAALLDVTEHTVKAHMVSIYRKLKPENRVELALIARENGITLKELPRVSTPQVED